MSHNKEMKKDIKEKNISYANVRGLEMFCVCVQTPEKKRKKKYFKSLEQARLYLKEYNKAVKVDLSDLAILSPLEIADIRVALSLLPAGVSLSECVKAFNSQLIKISMNEAINNFLANKKSLSKKYYANIKNRLEKFKEHFKKWENVSPSLISKWVKNISDSTKSQKHYYSIVKEFYDYAEIKKYAKNPFKEIHKSEVPTIKRKETKIPTVEEIKSFFEQLEKICPKVVGLYALVAFGGFRMAEAGRLKVKNINYEKEEIILPFKDSKTGQTWLQCKMTSNIWKWLKKYPPCELWGAKHIDRIIKEIKDSLKFERNALRHSFATYHLSLLRNPSETSILMRHTNPSQLWQTYLEGLTSEEIAKAYFDIVPKEEQAEKNIL